MMKESNLKVQLSKLNYNRLLIAFLFIFQFAFTQQKHIVIDYTNVVDSITLYVDQNNTEKRSAIGFIRKTQKRTSTEKKTIDTCYFHNLISKNPDYHFQQKISVQKIKKNVWKHYLVYHEDCRGFKLPKDSISLEGYFKILDNTKPVDGALYEPSLYNEPDPYDDNKVLRPVPLTPASTSEGWFSKGLKNGQWVFLNYSFAKTEEYYKNGIRDGLYTVNTENDSILYQTTFINGTGVEKIYRKDGSLYHIKHFKNGIQDYTKPYTIYYDSNKIAAKTDYVKGIVTEYYRNGTIFKTQQITLKNDIFYYNGLYKGYNKAGQLKEKQYYDHNTIIYTITYDTKERIQKIETGNMIQYFEKGKLKEVKFIP